MYLTIQHKVYKVRCKCLPTRLTRPSVGGGQKLTTNQRLIFISGKRDGAENTRHARITFPVMKINLLAWSRDSGYGRDCDGGVLDSGGFAGEVLFFGRMKYYSKLPFTDRQIAINSKFSVAVREGQSAVVGRGG